MLIHRLIRHWKLSKARVRGSLFADKPLAEWCHVDRSGEPWDSFRRATHLIETGDTSAAVDVLQSVARQRVESRHQIVAWHALRRLGVKPEDAVAKTVLGIVVEVQLSRGLEYLAIYPDKRIRYYNVGGSACIWEHPNDSLDPQINSLVSLAEKVIEQMGVWTGSPRPAPKVDWGRINILTPAGLYFSEGSLNALAADPGTSQLFVSSARLISLLRVSMPAM